MTFSTVVVLQVLVALIVVSHEAEARCANLTSFKDEHGSIIDCIDIHKQPALNHPLLKNHKIQLRPSSLPKGMREEARLNRGGPARALRECPYGTVPIMRTKRGGSNSTKANRALAHPIRAASINPSTSDSSGTSLFAGITTPDLSRKFYGGRVELSVYNLTNIVSPQISQTLLWLGSDVQGDFNSLEFGWTVSIPNLIAISHTWYMRIWMVNPQIYGDNRTRTYSLWTADGHKSTGCYNAECQGYVQVSRTAFLGAPIVPVSDPGHQTYYMEFFLFKDKNTGNWWLTQTLLTGKYEQVGYWPKELFTSMRDFAKVIQIGGKVYIPASAPGNPQMGSGAFVPNDLTRTCYATDIEFVNSDNQFYPPKDVNIKVVADKGEIYNADSMVDNSTSWGYTILFGGPDIKK
ncbi:hypothetical protein Cgig2_030007 [Carnegiea gigantea]|uniref:Neprosin PEP catalytic domain-containing protein n=1 Tax=Carnegiea gigantea TaxID=171969 RepID=A0A9Q1K653_9CARY|nr:hypothetical protein Cgig2_030007 [Carnegiea gigantea]